MNESASAARDRGSRFGPDAGERISAGCYGALVAASTLVGLTEASTGSLILIVVLTNLIYYATHVFAYTVGSPGEEGDEKAGWPTVRHHLAVSAPMVSVTFLPVALVVVLEVVGVDREPSVLAGVIVALAYLVVVATGGAFVRGLRPVTVVLVGVLTLVVSVALVAAKLSLH
ncbi:hypothetical protein N1028_13475 [Herbiconiux sp. CPCC 203407]|uniref:Uncharacterized protein n=1 Tax=Herbiconiux oxytropis TaxID=2970915 RepID=A0AA42BTX0_9MICO|nr:hypothetical protein [Herbiconiux oxytropis]MCS5723026.1 hypothetical protein [Herbiconiux oxytropis]MCS5726905.1 hypothetical protein [Herbiconiux oxytropis]